MTICHTKAPLGRLTVIQRDIKPVRTATEGYSEHKEIDHDKSVSFEIWDLNHHSWAWVIEHYKTVFAYLMLLRKISQMYVMQI